ncbi:ABC transporter substrate-binding protein [Oscillospiraceae bacterium OttesenSCG-928-F05]|nr:ABC transporter substrate-binding protein [Oscillospiraceae bacterium OttesenSCG-928-F05]
MKRLLTLALALIMLFALTACGETAVTPSPTGAPSTAQPADAANTPEPLADPTEIVVFVYGYSPKLDGLGAVLDAINAISREEINVVHDLVVNNSSAYVEQMNLMLAAQDDVDLFWSGTVRGYAAQAARGQLTPLDDLVDAYGQGIRAVLGDEYTEVARTTDGHYYGLISQRDHSSYLGLLVRKDFADQYSWDTGEVTGGAQLTALFADMRADLPAEMHVTAPITATESVGRNMMSLAEFDRYDPLGTIDLMGLSSYDSTTVALQLDNPNYVNACALSREWYAAGYMPSDVATTTLTGSEMIKSGVLASELGAINSASRNRYSGMAGNELVEIRCSTTSAAPGLHFLWSIPSHSEHPVEAMKFLNLMFASAEIENLYCYGIEGVDWEWAQDGKHIQYIGGGTVDDVSFYIGANFAWGNQFVSHIMLGDDLDVWERMEKDNREGKKSVGMGFSYDPSGMKTEYASITNVLDQYMKALETGTVSADDILDEFRRKMIEAGAEDVIADKQAQFDAWLAAKS